MKIPAEKRFSDMHALQVHVVEEHNDGPYSNTALYEDNENILHFAFNFFSLFSFYRSIFKGLLCRMRLNVSA